MPNILEMLRMRNIFGTPLLVPETTGPGRQFDIFAPKKPSPFENIRFGPEVDFSAPKPMQVTSSTPEFDVARRMSELYTPETEAGEQFNEMIGQQPRAQDYSPSFLRRIGSALAAFGPGGIESGMELLHRPFTQKLQDWKIGIGPAQQAANLERQQNINERTMAYKTVSQELRQRADEARSENNERRAEIAQQRANVYELKARNPNMKFDFSGPTVLMADPASGRVNNTGVPTGNMTDLDKIHLQQEGRITAIKEIGAQSRETEGVRQTGRETIAETRGWQVANIPDPTNLGQQIAVKINQVTGEVQPITMGDKQVGPIARPSGAGGRGAESPTQLKVRQFNSARQLASTRPDLAKFVKLGTGNNFTITQPGRFSGPTKEQFDEINSAIFGGALPIQQPTRTTPSAALTKTQTNQRTGEKRTLISTDNGKTWQVKDAPTAAR